MGLSQRDDDADDDGSGGLALFDASTTLERGGTVMFALNTILTPT